MSLIDDIRRDREAGTPGPWSAFTDDTAPHTNIVSPTPRTACVFSLAHRSKLEPDVKRIARVPAMEAALLAAHEALRKIANEPASDYAAEITRVDRLATDALDALEQAQ